MNANYTSQSKDVPVNILKNDVNVEAVDVTL